MKTLSQYVSCLVLLLAAELGCRSGPPPEPPLGALRIALTLDDLPWQGATAAGETRLQATQRLLAALGARRVPVTGFVNCARIDPEEPVLETWLSSGMELGNHTSRHLDLDRTELMTWIADVEECHTVLARLLPRAVRYFRYPMLHQGATEERRQAATAVLRRLGYATAHVTIDNSEWILGGAYSGGLRRGDLDAQRVIGMLYMQHIVDAVLHFDRLSHEALRRPVSHVLLLHANAVAADYLGEVIDVLRARGAVFITLDEALGDPIYTQPDRYLGPKGLSWLYRIRPELLGQWGGWDDEQVNTLQVKVPKL